MQTVGALLVAAAVSAGAVTIEPPITLPRPVLEAGLSKAQCTLAPEQAGVVGHEWLGHGLRIVEVSCWRTDEAAGSILFAVPHGQPGKAQLITLQDWRRGRIEPAHSVASPTYDRDTRTLGSSRAAGGAGDCGTIKEWKWTGWSFRLLHVWAKDDCDGEAFDWDSRHRWLVFPKRVRPVNRQPPPASPVRAGQNVRALAATTAAQGSAAPLAR